MRPMTLVLATATLIGLTCDGQSAKAATHSKSMISLAASYGTPSVTVTQVGHHRGGHCRGPYHGHRGHHYRHQYWHPPVVVPFPGHPPVVHPPIRHHYYRYYHKPYHQFHYRGNHFGFSFGF